ncbi:MAG: DUF2344 domain-containing protein, partial [Syntrophaceae bacterium]|nr:DUF2344 domain-containing protein [Syntrophaceae bacterium]
DNIDCGVSREFLLAERQKAADCLDTEDCRTHGCRKCGVCDFETTKNIFSASEDKIEQAVSAPSSPFSNLPIIEKHYRFTFMKASRARFLSHLELSAALIRALRRSSLSLSYSAGFHPHPKISFAVATSVGMESLQEFADVTARKYPANLSFLKNEINNALPAGVEIREIREMAFGEKDLAQALRGFCYELHLPTEINSVRLAALKNNIDKFLASTEFIIKRKAKGKIISRDIRPFVEQMILDSTEKKVSLTIRHAQRGSARPQDIIEHVLGFNEEENRQIRVVKVITLLD